MLRNWARFPDARGGLAAVEFALIAPVMLVTFFGLLELSMALSCNTRVNNMASTAADLVAQETAVSSSDTANVFGAATAILYPYATSGAKLVVSSLVDDGHGGAKVAWSDAQNGAPRTAGSSVSVPSGLIVSGSGGSVILAEITYAYTSPTLMVLSGPVTMKASFYSKPRRSLTVTHM